MERCGKTDISVVEMLDALQCILQVAYDASSGDFAFLDKCDSGVADGARQALQCRRRPGQQDKYAGSWQSPALGGIAERVFCFCAGKTGFAFKYDCVMAPMVRPGRSSETASRLIGCFCPPQVPPAQQPGQDGCIICCAVQVLYVVSAPHREGAPVAWP